MSGVINPNFESDENKIPKKQLAEIKIDDESGKLPDSAPAAGSEPDSTQPDDTTSINKLENGEYWQEPPQTSVKSSYFSLHVEESVVPDSFKDCRGLWRIIKRYRGMALALLTALLFSFASFLVAVLSRKHYSPYLSTLWRFLGIFLSSLPIIGYCQFYKKTNMFETIWPLYHNGVNTKTFVFLIIRCVVGVASFVFQYKAIELMPLADVSVIANSSTVFVVFFAWICLGEDCGIVPTILALLTIIGVIIIAKPPLIFGLMGEAKYEYEGIIYAIATLFANAASVILLRFLRDIHFGLMALAFGLAGVVSGFVLTYVFNGLVLPRSAFDAVIFVGMALSSCLGQITLTLALKYEDAGPVTTIRTSDACFSFLWQMIIHIFPNYTSLGGGILVLTCVFLTGIRKWIKSLDDRHPCKINFWFLLQ